MVVFIVYSVSLPIGLIFIVYSCLFASWKTNWQATAHNNNYHYVITIYNQ